jgi:dihydrofolate reductase
MRRIIWMMSVSVDGYMEGPNRDIDWHLVDEYRIYVHPVVIGRGKPMFTPSDVTFDLRSVETRTFGNGVVLLRYER